MLESIFKGVNLLFKIRNMTLYLTGPKEALDIFPANCMYGIREKNLRTLFILQRAIVKLFLLPHALLAQNKF